MGINITCFSNYDTGGKLLSWICVVPHDRMFEHPILLLLDENLRSVYHLALVYELWREVLRNYSGYLCCAFNLCIYFKKFHVILVSLYTLYISFLDCFIFAIMWIESVVFLLFLTHFHIHFTLVITPLCSTNLILASLL